MGVKFPSSVRRSCGRSKCPWVLGSWRADPGWSGGGARIPNNGPSEAGRYGGGTAKDKFLLCGSAVALPQENAQANAKPINNSLD